MANRLQGEVCIITGAARGIGAATARLFAQEGASVVLADIKDGLGEEIAHEICDQGGKAKYIHCNVICSYDTENLVQQTCSTFGRIDVFFNNAGTAIPGKLDQLSEKDWDTNFNVNVKSIFLCSKYVIPVMRKQGGGVIVNMASESGLIGYPASPAYCAAKAAVVNLTRSMATGHAHENIRVNCICPGTIVTPLYHEFMDALPNKDEVLQSVMDSHPLGLGTAEDIAYAALYLASDESKYMTGAPLIIDGGMTAN